MGGINLTNLSFNQLVLHDWSHLLGHLFCKWANFPDFMGSYDIISTLKRDLFLGKNWLLLLV